MIIVVALMFTGCIEPTPVIGLSKDEQKNYQLTMHANYNINCRGYGGLVVINKGTVLGAEDMEILRQSMPEVPDYVVGLKYTESPSSVGLLLVHPDGNLATYSQNVAVCDASGCLIGGACIAKDAKPFSLHK
ncbi:hypothetical protein N9A28_07985 [Sulfurimonas sp.]|nr:hypothetical protein [Sulfurimonas sp.]